jgi:hypothetical protein
MDEAALAFCKANTISVGGFFDGANESWSVSNARALGVLQPQQMSGSGPTLKDAVDAYVRALVTQRSIEKDHVAAYVADTAVATKEVVDVATADAVIKKTLAAAEVQVDEI